MTSKKIRYAVVGLGNIAQVAVLPAFANAKENSELAGLVSGEATKLAQLGERYGITALGSYADFERVMAEGKIDAVYVTTPNSLHRQTVERAARLGIHVLCEKPLARTTADCEAMITAAATAKVKLMTAYRLHFEKTNLSAIARVQQGEIGEPRLFSSVFSQRVRPGDIRTRPDLGGGALFDLGVYCINAARNLFRDEPIEVFGMQVEPADARAQGVDEVTSALLQFSGGRMAQFTASQGASDVAEYRVVGTNGNVELDPAFEYRGKNREYFTTDGKTHEATTLERDQFAPELIYFSRCILEDREPEPSGEEGLADVRIMEAIVSSAITGRKVALGPYARSQRPGPELEMRKPPVDRVATVHAPSPTK